MSARRTQIYLTQAQRERIDRVARSKGITMAEVIRTAVDEYLADSADPTEAFAATFGRDPDAELPSRDEWERG